MSCNFELVCNDVDCGTVMELVHGGHMFTKSAYNYRCPNDGCNNWTTIVIEGDGCATVEEPLVDDTEVARLAGYVTKPNRFELSVNLSTDTIQNHLRTYKCGEGNTWLPLRVNLDRLDKVLNGERRLTTVVQRGDE